MPSFARKYLKSTTWCYFAYNNQIKLWNFQTFECRNVMTKVQDNERNSSNGHKILFELRRYFSYREFFCRVWWVMIRGPKNLFELSEIREIEYSSFRKSTVYCKLLNGQNVHFRIKSHRKIKSMNAKTYFYLDTKY